VRQIVFDSLRFAETILRTCGICGPSYAPAGLLHLNPAISPGLRLGLPSVARCAGSARKPARLPAARDLCGSGATNIQWEAGATNITSGKQARRIYRVSRRAEHTVGSRRAEHYSGKRARRTYSGKQARRTLQWEAGATNTTVGSGRDEHTVGSRRAEYTSDREPLRFMQAVLVHAQGR
jgi:hypothetical protein